MSPEGLSHKYIEMKKAFAVLLKYGVSGFLRRLYRKFYPSRYENNELISGFDKIKPLFLNKKGIEIGGPSNIFVAHIPLYGIVSKLDGCNFSTDTVWEGRISEGDNNFRYGSSIGYQYLEEAADLRKVESEKYDFIISSNCLEHIANPLKAVGEWLRVIKKTGIILIIVPNKNYCFDHRRAFTTFSHLLDDYNKQTDEHDLTHLDEVLALHDLSLDSPAGTIAQFKQRSLKNFENRCLHHHVFNIRLLKKIFRFFNVEILYSQAAENYIIMGRKSSV
jgi:SAM-dependent methyltransferase